MGTESKISQVKSRDEKSDQIRVIRAVSKMEEQLRQVAALMQRELQEEGRPAGTVRIDIYPQTNTEGDS